MSLSLPTQDVRSLDLILEGREAIECRPLTPSARIISDRNRRLPMRAHPSHLVLLGLEPS